MDLGLDAMRGLFGFLGPHLDEKQRRLLAGALAKALGTGSTTAVADAAGMSRSTVLAGRRDVEAGIAPTGRVRREGGGRPRIEIDPEALVLLNTLVSPAAAERTAAPAALQWSSGSVRQLTSMLADAGHHVPLATVSELVKAMGFTILPTATTVGGSRHADREAQFAVIAGLAASRLAAGDPVVSVVTTEVDEQQLPGGDDREAAAVDAVRRWWRTLGAERTPEARRLLVAPAIGSGAGHVRWKAGIARFAADTGITVTVCHFPAGAVRWARVEHRLVRSVRGWRTVVEAAAVPGSDTAMRILEEWDRIEHIPPGRPRTATVGHVWHPQWNYDIVP